MQNLTGKSINTNSSVKKIKIENMICQYGKKVVLDIPSLSLDCGDIVAVIGHNGAGKSTFAECFCGIQKSKGKVFLEDKPLTPKIRIAKSYMVMQDVNHQLFTESVLDELTLNIPEEKKSIADSVLSKMGISELADIHPLALSGGQKQRVAIAAAVCGAKEFLLYDEPTSGLDYESMKATCGLISKAAKDALISLVITHDLEFILGCCTSVLHIENGKVKEHYPLDNGGINNVKNYFNIRRNQIV